MRSVIFWNVLRMREMEYIGTIFAGIALSSTTNPPSGKYRNRKTNRNKKINADACIYHRSNMRGTAFRETRYKFWLNKRSDRFAFRALIFAELNDECSARGKIRAERQSILYWNGTHTYTRTHAHIHIHI